ncbi:MAG: DUF4981 domain-containing protein [Lachnospiraceae bacterium]|nr:DUF4981 domain-containing protein [Lachnospiraceae bacterium]
MIVPRYYEDLKMLHENTMPARSYYMPASRQMDTLAEKREQSDRMQLLNGKWQFRYFKSIYELQDAFYQTDYDRSSFEWIQVPGVWQMMGYDTHQYTNIRYPFPFDPPYVPQDNPCGAYVREFTYKKDLSVPSVYLNFEGVDSCFYVWVNGVYIGYSQISHATSEFDISGAIIEGSNTLAVLVLKWCDGSYLEDQDKFRMSGIFRDVYLLKRPKQAVWDYFIQTELKEGTASISIQTQYLEKSVPTAVALFDADGSMVDYIQQMDRISNRNTSNPETQENSEKKEQKFQAEQQGILTIADPILWNPENPYLYTLVIETEQETIVDYVGLREIKVIDQAVYLNGVKIKFHGVNRHESDPITGFTVSLEQMKQDFTLMKQHNINAIRTSHYPNVPIFYQFCDKYGFMVIDEADIESHGPCEIFYADNSDANKFDRWNEPIADNPEWEEAILDRVKHCVQRDKNRPCVLIWSMGNESAFGCNFEKALKWTKEFDSSRLTHYESARYRKHGKNYDFSNLDLYSRMYPGFDEIQEYLERKPEKPFILCEYCHSMGNGPGDLEDYFVWIDQYDWMCGGFVWEWCDHAVAHRKTSEGKMRYYYGGDHGEKIHDGNFCMDGLVYPDRTPHIGLLEYKNVYRPARVVSFKQDTKELKIKNYMEFTDLASYIEIRYEVDCDGVSIETGILPIDSIQPKQTETVNLPITVLRCGKTYLKLYYHLKEDSELVSAGHLLGFDEILLETEDSRNQTARKWLEQRDTKNKTITTQETDTEVICKGECFEYRYDKRTGLFTTLNYKGTQYLDRPMELNIWRAPTDNDQNIQLEWKRAQYNQAYTRAYYTIVKQTAAEWDQTGQSISSVKIGNVLSVVAASVQRILEIEASWVIGSDGSLSFNSFVKRNMEFPMLPRFGIRLFLNQKLATASYYGMGPFESYQDKHRASSHGTYHAPISCLHEDYLYPQENGSHMDCDYVTLESEQFGLTAVSEQPFSFQASPYTQEELEQKKHHYELQPSGSTILCLDYKQSGIGSNSCGPELLEKYRLEEKEFIFAIKIIPFTKKN